MMPSGNTTKKGKLIMEVSMNVESTNNLKREIAFRKERRILFVFFQAEDGIRVFHVTGVQTCALPILGNCELTRAPSRQREPSGEARIYLRSEERRVGKECRSRWSPDLWTKKLGH